MALVLVALLAGTGYLLHRQNAPAARATGDALSPSARPRASTAAVTSTSPSPRAKASGSRPATWFPQHGPGTFASAHGGTARFGTGRLLRYDVKVEQGLAQTADGFAAQVDAILDDTHRGWAAGGLWSFQRVSSGPVDFTVYLVTPDTTDRMCAKYGLDTGGWVNCSAGKQVVMNVKRWLLLTQYYTGQADEYHALAINHEVGHRLGHGHVTCPGAGRPAPVMMQQIKGMHGCVPNGWPYDGKGHYLTGPAV
ncbi:DUF3152 domain-containing protein [Streptacidiphilus monticola]|uniref:DUF3152 domain-containing protein n=1 Tax=Streptacidiphilus monticola TaxID=2161674 RepID=A0ABW1FZG8_9ACTN